MQISKFSDFSFRALLYLAAHPEKLCTVEELAEKLDTSSHHMKKVVHRLACVGYISSLKGRNGGIRLGMTPQEINLAEVLEYTEENLNLFDCFTQETCPILSRGCKLKDISVQALNSFFKEFSSYTLADLL